MIKISAHSASKTTQDSALSAPNSSKPAKHPRFPKNSAAFIFTLLGMLTAFGPFVTDMYLPTLPVMTSFFNTNISMVQMGLTASMLGLALGQLLFGPLSDKYGRRKPLLCSLLIYSIVTFFCIFSPNIETFVFLRFAQGLAASGGIVIARSIAADKFKKQNLSKALAIVGAINGIAPIAAPVIGGIMLIFCGWQGIFGVLMALGLILLACCYYFRESLSTERRSKKDILKTLKDIPLVLKNRVYLFFTLELSFALAILFAYIASAPFILQNHFGFSPFVFSLFFAANAVGIGIGSGISVKFKSEKQALTVSCIGMLAATLGLSLGMRYNLPVAIYEALLFITCTMLGISFTISTSKAMDAERRRAGSASAVLGSMGFLFGSIVSPLAGLGNILTTSGLVQFICALCAAFCAWLAFHHAAKARLKVRVKSAVRRLKRLTKK